MSVTRIDKQHHTQSNQGHAKIKRLLINELHANPSLSALGASARLLRKSMGMSSAAAYYSPIFFGFKWLIDRGCAAYLHKTAIYAREGSAPGQPHRQQEFFFEDMQHITYPCLAIDCQAPDHRTPNQDGTCAQRQRFEDVCAAPDATIHIDLAAASYSLNHLRQRLNRWQDAIKLASTMI